MIGSAPSYPPFGTDMYLHFEMLDIHKEYLVCVKMINLHVSLNEALTSGLFGRLGEERIVLVSTTDEEALQKYYKLWAAEPKEYCEPERSFKEDLRTGLLQQKVDRWLYELRVYWLRFKCVQAIRNDVATQEDLASIWFDTIGPEDGKLGAYAEGPGANWSGLFDEDHPFAKTVFENMPRFSPVIMFRLCEMNCYSWTSIAA